MISRNSTFALIISLVFTAPAAVRAAETTPASDSSTVVPAVTISARSDALFCDGLPPDQARRLARNAQRDGAHAKAVECFRIAGDLVRADGAQLHASADAGAASAQRIKANMETAKAQARRLREAWR